MQLATWLKSPEKLNIILSPSLSGNNSVKINLAPAVKELESKIKNESTFYQKPGLYELQTTKSLVSSDNITIKGFNDHLPEFAPPAIKEARDKALSKINSLLAKVSKVKEKYIQEDEDITCPYEQTKAKFLGKDYTPPSIEDLTYPEDFSIEKALSVIASINAHYYNVMLTQAHYMSAEAIDTNFPGITSENIGNAFSVPFITENGTTHILNKKKVADHIEFAEIVRSIPMQQMIDEPKEVAFKLIHRFIQINSDIDMTKDLPFSVTPFEVPSMEPIPEPQIDPMPSPRKNPLPIDHPSLQYITQPNFFSSAVKPQEIKH